MRALCVVCLTAGCGRAAPTFSMAIDGDAVAVTASFEWDRMVADADAEFDWERVLALRVEGAETHPPMTGTYSTEGRVLVFKPGFPLLEGKRYVARFDPRGLPGARGGAALEKTFTAGAPGSDAGARAGDAAAPALTAVYPTAETLPANHLKFYLVFSEPMRRGDIFRHARIVRDDGGGEVPEPFRETELWSGDGRRLTLWLHPGRQKTGVNLNVEIGPVLEEGFRYRLVIAREWESERGIPLGRDFEKPFAARAADHDQPRVADWDLEAPGGGTTDAVGLSFPEPFDRALLESKLRVETDGGEPVDGRVRVAEGERSWEFAPQNAWMPGRYRIAVETVLEDLAGNSLARPFEVDVTAASVAERDAVVYLPFEVRKE